MAAKKTEKFRCCFCDHKSVLVDGVHVGEGFVLTEDHKSNKKFMQIFNRALETKVICPL
jgi:hypothetical protein